MLEHDDNGPDDWEAPDGGAGMSDWSVSGAGAGARCPESRYVRGVDYTAAIRQAEIGERLIRRVLSRVAWPGARIVTWGWSTPHGEPFVRVELHPALWFRLLGQLDHASGRERPPRRRRVMVRGVVAAYQRNCPAVRAARRRRNATRNRQ
jgi:hypothetical protein